MRKYLESNDTDASQIEFDIAYEPGTPFMDEEYSVENVRVLSGKMSVDVATQLLQRDAADLWHRQERDNDRI
jgi:hypothetical protein